MDAVRRAARASSVIARDLRNPRVEFRGRWLLDLADYREGRDRPPRPARVQAARSLGPWFVGAAAYVEAAFAWRTGSDQALPLAIASVQGLQASQLSPLCALVRGLVVHLTARPPESEIKGIIEVAQNLGPDWQAQVLALLGPHVSDEDRERGRHAATSLLASRPAEVRLDLLSPAECASLLG